MTTALPRNGEAHEGACGRALEGRDHAPILSTPWASAIRSMAVKKSASGGRRQKGSHQCGNIYLLEIFILTRNIYSKYILVGFLRGIPGARGRRGEVARNSTHFHDIQPTRTVEQSAQRLGCEA